MIFDWSAAGYFGAGIFSPPPYVPVPPEPYTPDEFTRWLYRQWWTVPQTDDTGWAAFFSAILLEFIHFLTGTFLTVEAGSTATVDLSLARNFTVDLTSDKALTLTNPISGMRYIFVVEQGGNFHLTFATSVKWFMGAPYTTTNGVGEYDVVTLVYNSARGYTGIYAKGMA